MADKEKKPVEKIQQLTEELLGKMGVEAKVTVEEDEKNKMFKISLSSPEDNALLVGRFGRNLEALQTILNLMTANALGEWQRVLVDIDGYRQKREEQLEKMGVEAKVAVEEDKKNKMFKISLSSPEDNALLVGRFGRNLEALQTILNLMTANALGEWQRVLVDIDGYRQKREEQLEKMAQEALEKVAATGEPVTFPGLSSFERRVIHLYFKDKPEMETLSEGEGRDRYLVVRRRQGEE